MSEDELKVLKLLTIAAICYSKWKDAIESQIKGNKEIANLYFNLPTVQYTHNNIALSKLSQSNINVNEITSVEELVKIMDLS